MAHTGGSRNYEKGILARWGWRNMRSQVRH